MATSFTPLTGVGGANFGPRPTSGIDFMAIARGEELANQLNWRDELRQLDRQRLYDTLNDMDMNKTAQAYVSTLMRNKQIAADAGVTPADFLVQQRAQIMADPAFQALAPEVQDKVLTTLGQTAALSMETLVGQGDFQSAQNLARAYGLIPQDNLDWRQAVMAGDPAQALAAFNARNGTNIQMDADGNVDVGGVKMSAMTFLSSVQKAGGQGGAAWAIGAAQEQAAAEQARQLELLEQQRKALGLDTQPAQPAQPAPGAGPAQPVGTPGQQAVDTAFGGPTTSTTPVGPVVQTTPAVPVLPTVQPSPFIFTGPGGIGASPAPAATPSPAPAQSSTALQDLQFKLANPGSAGVPLAQPAVQPVQRDPRIDALIERYMKGPGSVYQRQ